MIYNPVRCAAPIALTPSVATNNDRRLGAAAPLAGCCCCCCCCRDQCVVQRALVFLGNGCWCISKFRRLHWQGNWIVEIPDALGDSLSCNFKNFKCDLNRNTSPDQWSMTVRQFQHFVGMCRRDTVTWTMLDQCTAHGKAAGKVNGYQLCNSYVKPFTRGTGCSVALLYNNAKPLSADIMISHTWAEDVIEVQEAIHDIAMRHPKGNDLVIWFCIFGNYQCGEEPGDMGPTVSEQLMQDPFGTVINSPQLESMCLVITAEEDPYDRLWCVYELSVALDVQEEMQKKTDKRALNFVQVEFSDRGASLYLQRMNDWCADARMALDWEAKDGFTRHLSADEQNFTFPEWKQKQTAERLTYLYYLTTQDLSKADCSTEEDKKMITSKVVNRNGGWQELNHKMATFRSRVL